MKQRVSSPTMAAWLVSGATALCGTAAHAVTAAPKPEITASAAKSTLIKAAPKPIKAPDKTGCATVTGKGDAGVAMPLPIAVRRLAVGVLPQLDACFAALGLAESAASNVVPLARQAQ